MARAMIPEILELTAAGRAAPGAGDVAGGRLGRRRRRGRRARDQARSSRARATALPACPRPRSAPPRASASSPACARPGACTSATGSARSQNWVGLQEEYDCIYCVVDLHALTTGFEDVSRIHEDGIEMLADWIGAGVDPERSIVFRQSQVPEHAELALLLGMITPKSWLERVPDLQGPDRRARRADRHLRLLRLSGAPDRRHRPLPRDAACRSGQDQLPHLELAREIVRRFNHLYGGGRGGASPSRRRC